MFQNKRVFKVIAPMEKKDGGTWWMEVGAGYENKDNSINIYLQALPLAQQSQQGAAVRLQLRELTEEEMRERSARRAARGAVGGPASGIYNAPVGGASPSAEPVSDVPF